MKLTNIVKKMSLVLILVTLLTTGLMQTNTINAKSKSDYLTITQMNHMFLSTRNLNNLVNKTNKKYFHDNKKLNCSIKYSNNLGHSDCRFSSKNHIMTMEINEKCAKLINFLSLKKAIKFGLISYHLHESKHNNLSEFHKLAKKIGLPLNIKPIHKEL